MHDVTDVVFQDTSVQHVHLLILVGIEIKLAALAGGASYFLFLYKAFFSIGVGKKHLRVRKLVSSIKPDSSYFAIGQKRQGRKPMAVVS